MTTRRDFLAGVGATAAASLLPPKAWSSMTTSPSRGQLAGIGVQLYLLRQAMQADVEGTIARIARMGFREIEWWGSYGRSAEELRRLLDQHGLRSPAVHVDARALQPEQLEATLDRAAAMGQRWVIVPSTNPPERSAEGYAALGRLLSAAGQAGASRGIRTGFHNHDYDFAARDGDILWDVLARESDPAVVDLELDCYWAFRSGHDPLAVLRAQGNRIVHLHIKDSMGPPAHRMVDAGAGVLDWRAIIDEGLARGVRHVYVEHDSPADAWTSAAAGLGHLKALGY